MRRTRVQVGADVAVGLAAPEQVGQVTGDRAGCSPGRLDEAGLGGQGGRVGEEYAV